MRKGPIIVFGIGLVVLAFWLGLDGAYEKGFNAGLDFPFRAGPEIDVATSEQEKIAKLEDKVDFLVNALPLKEKCRYDDKFFYGQIDFLIIPNSTWIEECGLYVEKVEQHYKIP